MDIKQVYLFWEEPSGFKSECVKIKYTTGERMYLEENVLSRKWVERKMLGIAADKNTNKKQGISIVDVNQETGKKNLIKYLNYKIQIKNKEIKKIEKYIKLLEV